MSRAGVLSIVSIALFLTSPLAGRQPDDAARRGASTRAIDAPAVERILAQVNRALSPPERKRIAAAVVRYSDKYGLDPALVTAVMLVESSARPWVRSPKGATGLMQVMPHIHAPMQMAGNLATIESNIEAGCLILAHNIQRLGEEEGVLAYFWGSDIRGGAYLQRVRAARADVERRLRL
ncbi:MAG: transglycosylase SLT domain-containing protein [Deltaproteobacteria bacterium]|nr:MAG: transglycosylase SLT domain-containing protein [Deltaproteobacteria bacterium]